MLAGTLEIQPVAKSLSQIDENQQEQRTRRQPVDQRESSFWPGGKIIQHVAVIGA